MKNLVYVYLGKYIPKYVLANVTSSASQFPDKNFFFISSPESIYPKFSSPNITELTYKPNSFKLSVSCIGIKYNSNFRNGFWVKTLERFFALQSFSSSFKEPFIHVESDVILFDNFPFDKFDLLDGEIAFPLINRNLGIASILAFKNEAALFNFLNFIVLQQSEVNDMEILGSYLAQYSRRVSILPTANSEMVSEKYVELSFNFLQNNFHIFNGFFDGATLGQYIFGLDARSSFGLRKIGFNHGNHPIDPDKIDFHLINRNLFLDPKKDSAVFNLHIHSKHMAAFNAVKRLDYLSKTLKSNGIKSRTVFSLGDAYFHFNELFSRFVRKISLPKKRFLMKGYRD